MADVSATTNGSGGIESPSCLEGRLARLYAYTTGIGGIETASCLAILLDNLEHAFTMPITVSIKKRAVM